MWEQNDAGTGTPLTSEAKSNGPLFRQFGTRLDNHEYDPHAYGSCAPLGDDNGENCVTTDPTRVFPDMRQILARQHERRDRKLRRRGSSEPGAAAAGADRLLLRVVADTDLPRSDALPSHRARRSLRRGRHLERRHDRQPRARHGTVPRDVAGASRVLRPRGRSTRSLGTSPEPTRRRSARPRSTSSSRATAARRSRRCSRTRRTTDRRG